MKQPLDIFFNYRKRQRKKQNFLNVEHHNLYISNSFMKLNYESENFDIFKQLKINI